MRFGQTFVLSEVLSVASFAVPRSRAVAAALAAAGLPAYSDAPRGPHGQRRRGPAKERSTRALTLGQTPATPPDDVAKDPQTLERFLRETKPYTKGLRKFITVETRPLHSKHLARGMMIAI